MIKILRFRSIISQLPSPWSSTARLSSTVHSSSHDQPAGQSNSPGWRLFSPFCAIQIRKSCLLLHINLHDTSLWDSFLYTVQCEVHSCSHYLGAQGEVLTTSVKASEAVFHSRPGKRTSFWKTSSMNSVCPASASVNKLQHKVRIVSLKREHNMRCHVVEDDSAASRKQQDLRCISSDCLQAGGNLNGAQAQSLIKSCQENWIPIDKIIRL